jgi:hypothetical protein
MLPREVDEIALNNERSRVDRDGSTWRSITLGKKAEEVAEKKVGSSTESKEIPMVFNVGRVERWARALDWMVKPQRNVTTRSIRQMARDTALTTSSVTRCSAPHL